jgi:hypothetical protein
LGDGADCNYLGALEEPEVIPRTLAIPLLAARVALPSRGSLRRPHRTKPRARS